LTAAGMAHSGWLAQATDRKRHPDTDKMQKAKENRMKSHVFPADEFFAVVSSTQSQQAKAGAVY